LGGLAKRQTSLPEDAACALNVVPLQTLPLEGFFISGLDKKSTRFHPLSRELLTLSVTQARAVKI
jgi:hypothetical protein